MISGQFYGTPGSEATMSPEIVSASESGSRVRKFYCYFQISPEFSLEPVQIFFGTSKLFFEGSLLLQIAIILLKLLWRQERHYVAVPDMADW